MPTLPVESQVRAVAHDARHRDRQRVVASWREARDAYGQPAFHALAKRFHRLASEYDTAWGGSIRQEMPS